MSDKKFPCIDCICIPICRHKQYMDLFNDCILLKKYEPAYNSLVCRDTQQMYQIEETLKPTKWGIYNEKYKESISM